MPSTSKTKPEPRPEPEPTSDSMPKPKRLLFVALAGNGHINPTLPLVEELVRRGHQVEYATGTEHARAVAGAGARWLELPVLEPFTPPSHIGPDIMAAWLRHYFAAMTKAYPVLRDRCEAAEPPDAVCYDTTNWPARVVAENAGIPAIRLVPHFASNEKFSLDAHLAQALGSADGPEALVADREEFSRTHGVAVDRVDPLTEPVTELNLVFVPRAFQPHGDGFDERHHFVGPSLGGRQGAERWQPRDPRAPLVYVSLGSVATGTADFYRRCVDAFAGTPWQVAMTVGDTDPAAMGPLPSTVEVRNSFPQLAVLRHADAFVTHAGMNSVLETLHYGVGMVTLPHTPEQSLNADRVEQLGLGTRLDRETFTPAAQPFSRGMIARWVRTRGTFWTTGRRRRGTASTLCQPSSTPRRSGTSRPSGSTRGGGAGRSGPAGRPSPRGWPNASGPVAVCSPPTSTSHGPAPGAEAPPPTASRCSATTSPSTRLRQDRSTSSTPASSSSTSPTRWSGRCGPADGCWSRTPTPRCSR
jgi:MGT family glycosyltransferase